MKKSDLPFIEETGQSVLAGEEISFADACRLMQVEGPDIYHLLAWASQIRERFKGKTIHFCGIINAKSGRCPEDCAFCAQSIYHKTQIEVYPLMSVEEILKAAEKGMAQGARRISIVTSGRTVEEKELQTICKAIKGMVKMDIQPCASLGLLDKDVLLQLKEAGLKRYHHNLQTAPDFYPQICTTHSYEAKIETVRQAKATSLEICCGGIVGMGETVEQQLKLAFLLKELGVDAVPLNFLHPIPGTKLENLKLLTPLTCLKIIAVYRFILPQKEIIICGGRELNLRQLQNFMFVAGATGTIVGNYLTTKGRTPEADKELVEDMELK
ncbi:MAG: biotin synthase BioB [Candidatus Desulfofervidaceae bacterium]|nr:biotin synthase BioB [Candidatus Desulfofervidaceae bacterium]